VLRPSYPVETARLLLRPVVAGDLDALHAIQSREDVTRWLYYGPRTREETEERLAELSAADGIRADGDHLVLAIQPRDMEELVGTVVLMYRSAEHRQGEIGFVLHPRHHGRGYASEAAREMLRMGFEQLRLHRIVGRCEARNTASARLLERLGMRREAHFRENEFIKGEWQDELVYAMLAEEWLARA
jgi:RimJ/RimL family protein N-acetyltransferase